MKRFDAQSVKARLMDRLRVKRNWAIISENGTMSALLDTIAEGCAEVARYGEYLLNEKKWTTAQNISSLTSQMSLIGRKSHRQRSAIGYVIVSHTDAGGVNRLDNLGTSFFNLDDASNYDNISKDPDPQDPAKIKTLVPWTYDAPYRIVRGTRFIAASGVEFIATDTVVSRALKEPFSIIKNDETRSTNFYAQGGWDKIKYLKVPIIQGKQKTYTFGSAQGSRFESLLLPVANCEDATNSISSQLLKIYVSTGGAKEEWVQATNLLLAGPYDKVFEVTNKPDYSGVIFKFGDGVTGALLPVGAEVTVEYVETLGDKGNISAKYQIDTIIPPEGHPMIDPRTNTQSQFLSVTNAFPILGGQGVESEETIRSLAPTDYLQYYSIATTSAYETQIERYSQVGLSKVKVFAGQKLSELAQGSTSQNVVYFTAIANNGEKVEDAENSLLKPIAAALSDLKAPGDTLSYVDPDFLQLRLNTVVYSSDVDTSNEEIIEIEKQAIYDQYAILNRNFKQSFYHSELTKLVSNFPFVDYVETQIEAVTEPSYSISDVVVIHDDKAVSNETRNPTLYKLPFQFSNVFASGSYNRGFKNYKHSVPALLRVDLIFDKDSTVSSTKNRTFFLYDHRNNYTGPENLTIAQGKQLQEDGTASVSNNKGVGWRRPDEISEAYLSRVCRTAQFPFISEITNEAFMISQAKATNKAPFEIRPYVVGSDGRNTIYNASDVTWPSNEEDPRVFLPGNAQCYKQDWRYIDYFDIEFAENYDTPDSAAYAKGSLILPATYFGFDEGSTDIVNKSLVLGTIQNNCKIKIYVQPIMTDITLKEDYQIMFADQDDMLVERVTLTKS